MARDRVPAIPYIETRELTRTFGRHYALHRVTLRFEAGELCVLLGPNGSGKSTLLNLLSTLDRPSRGEIRWGPTLTRRQMVRFGRGAIGWVAHDSLVYEELTATENLAFYGQLYRLDRVSRRVAQALDEVGLEAAGHRPVRTFSRGMRQRLSLARALLAEPEVLLLDEPLTGLDRDGRARLLDLLGRARSDGRLVIVSTHALDLPPGLIDRVVVLRRGRAVYQGPVEGDLAELYERALRGRERSASPVGGGVGG